MNSGNPSPWFSDGLLNCTIFSRDFHWSLMRQIEKRTLKRGQCQMQIARDIHLIPIIVSNIWKQFKNVGSIEKKGRRPGKRPGKGRPSTSTANEDRYLFITANVEQIATASQLCRDLRSITVEWRFYLHCINLCSYQI